MNLTVVYSSINTDTSIIHIKIWFKTRYLVRIFYDPGKYELLRENIDLHKARV